MANGILHNFNDYDDAWSLCKLLFKESFERAENTRIIYGSIFIFRLFFVPIISILKHLYFEILRIFYCFATNIYNICMDFFVVTFLSKGDHDKKESIWNWVNCFG